MLNFASILYQIAIQAKDWTCESSIRPKQIPFFERNKNSLRTALVLAVTKRPPKKKKKKKQLQTLKGGLQSRTGYRKSSIDNTMDPPSPRKSYAADQVPDRPTAMKPTGSAPRNVTEFLKQKIVELTSVRNSLLKERDNIINGKELMDPEFFQDQLKEILDKLAPMPQTSRHSLNQKGLSNKTWMRS